MLAGKNPSFSYRISLRPGPFSLFSYSLGFCRVLSAASQFRFILVLIPGNVLRSLH